jgi:hypothetical protein
MMHRTLVVCVAAMALAATPAAAQSLDKTFVAQVGPYFPSIDSKLRVDASNGAIGTTIDFERDLGFNRRQVLPSVLAEWRPGDDWLINAQFYTLGRRSTKALERDIAIGDTVYPVAAEVSAGFESSIVRFTVGNRFFQRPNIEIGAAVGLHGTDFTVFLEGQGSVAGGTRSFRTENRSIFAPLPTVGLFLSARPAPLVLVNARIDYLSLTIDEYRGRLINTEVSAAYSVRHNIDIGVMFRLVDYRVAVERPDWNGRVDYRFSGPAMFVQVGF